MFTKEELIERKNQLDKDYSMLFKLWHNPDEFKNLPAFVQMAITGLIDSMENYSNSLNELIIKL